MAWAESASAKTTAASGPEEAVMRPAYVVSHTMGTNPHRESAPPGRPPDLCDVRSLRGRRASRATAWRARDGWRPASGPRDAQLSARARAGLLPRNHRARSRATAAGRATLVRDRGF